MRFFSISERKKSLSVVMLARSKVHLNACSGRTPSGLPGNLRALLVNLQPSPGNDTQRGSPRHSRMCKMSEKKFANFSRKICLGWFCSDFPLPQSCQILDENWGQMSQAARKAASGNSRIIVFFSMLKMKMCDFVILKLILLNELPFRPFFGTSATLRALFFESLSHEQFRIK